MNKDLRYFKSDDFFYRWTTKTTTFPRGKLQLKYPLHFATLRTGNFNANFRTCTQLLATAHNFPPSNILVYIIVPNPSKSRAFSPFSDEKFLRKYSNALGGAAAGGRPSQSSSVKDHPPFGVHFSPFSFLPALLVPPLAFFSLSLFLRFLSAFTCSVVQPRALLRAAIFHPPGS